MAPRFKVRFPDVESLRAALSTEAPSALLRVASERRRFLALEFSAAQEHQPGLASSFDQVLRILQEHYKADIIDDYQYQLDTGDVFDRVEPDDVANPSLDDVLDQIRARAVWPKSRGRGLTIAIVDTGINGRRAEIPDSKRQGEWATPGDDAWTDYQGHGTMCACIAAGTRELGGYFDGVAPDAGVISCKTRFYDSELADIYDYLVTRVTKDGLRIVASNSFGRKTGSPPSPPTDSDFLDALTDAVNAGIIVCFSAGNNHQLAGGQPERCDPTSIWLHKCREDVLAVATCKLNDSMWYYSSRGPGQHHGHLGTGPKPDVTAPTPENGRIVYGDQIVTMPNGWGTSGACPQVAGLAGLLLAVAPSLDRAGVFSAIRTTAVSLGWGYDCQGRGRIDCKAAMDVVAP